MATYYFHPTAGLDANAGTTTGAPKQTATAAATLFAAGHTVLFARGTVFRPTFGAYMFDPSVSVHNGQTWGAYDSGDGSAKPIFDALLYDDGPSGWAYVANGYWAKDFASTNITALDGRTWFGVLNQTETGLETDVGKLRASQAACTALKHYHRTYGAEIMTVYTGGDSSDTGNAATSAFNPYNFYGGMAMTARIFGSAPVIGRFRALNGETIRDIHWKGCGVATQSGCFNAQFIDCTATHQPREYSGLTISIETNGQAENVKIVRFTYDAVTSSAEDEGDSSGWGAMNGISCSPVSTTTGYVRNVEITDANIKNARHACIQAHGDVATVLDAVSGIVIKATVPHVSSVLDCSGIDYGRSLNISAAGWLATGLVITGNPTTSQLGGSGRLSGCLIKDDRYGTTTTDNHPNSTISVFPRDGITGTARFTTTSVDIVGNVFLNLRGYAVHVVDRTTFPQPSGSVRIRNNLFIDQTYYASRLVGPTGQYSGPGATILARCASSGVYFDFPVFPVCQNNVFVVPSGQTNIYAHNNNDAGSVAYGGADNSYYIKLYTANDAGAPVVPSGNQVFNTLAEAGIDANYNITSASSAYRSGVFAGYESDPSGKQRWNPPSVGAYEAI